RVGGQDVAARGEQLPDFDERRAKILQIARQLVAGRRRLVARLIRSGNGARDDQVGSPVFHEQGGDIAVAPQMIRLQRQTHVPSASERVQRLSREGLAEELCVSRYTDARRPHLQAVPASTRRQALALEPPVDSAVSAAGLSLDAQTVIPETLSRPLRNARAFMM